MSVYRADLLDHFALTSATFRATRAKVEWVQKTAGARFCEIELSIRVLAAKITSHRASALDSLATDLRIPSSVLTDSHHVIFGTEEEVITASALSAWYSARYTGTGSELMAEASFSDGSARQARRADSNPSWLCIERFSFEFPVGPAITLFSNNRIYFTMRRVARKLTTLAVSRFSAASGPATTVLRPLLASYGPR